MPKFNIEITRTSSVTNSFEIEADTAEQASEMAREQAMNTHFDHSQCAFPEYEVSSVEELEEDEEEDNDPDGNGGFY